MTTQQGVLPRAVSPRPALGGRAGSNRSSTGNAQIPSTPGGNQPDALAPSIFNQVSGAKFRAAGGGDVGGGKLNVAPAS